MGGKHAMAHASGFAIPSFHNLPGEMVEGGKGCGGCHKFGPTNAEQFAKLKKGGLGTQSSTCDACHTRHTYSKTEASQPQACMTCHQGPDHETYQMYAFIEARRTIDDETDGCAAEEMLQHQHARPAICPEAIMQ